MSRAAEKLYLGYLLAAPLGATVMATLTYAGPGDFVLGLLWLGGAVVVALYAVFVATYLVAPTAWWRMLLAIVDGPLVVAIAALTLHGWRVLDLLTWFFVAEALGICLGVAAVALRKRESVSVALMLGCAAVVCYASGWALIPRLAGDLQGALLFALSVAQATVMAYWIADRDRVVRGEDVTGTVGLVTIGLFHVALGLGALLRFVVLA